MTWLLERDVVLFITFGAIAIAAVVLWLAMREDHRTDFWSPGSDDPGD